VLGRRLDRYVTSYFLWHFALTLVAILGLYVIVDTFSKLDDFVEQEDFMAQIRWIAKYHLFQIPVLLTEFLPIITALAGVISVARLARYNELNAMKAAGISLQRTLLPILLCAVAVGGLSALNQEYLVPSLEDDIRNLKTTVLKTNEVEEELWSFDTKENLTVFARELHNAVVGYEIATLEARPLPSFDPERATPVYALRAKRGIWVDTWLFLFDAEVMDPQGAWHTYANKALRTDGGTDRFDIAAAPSAKLADGTAAYSINAEVPVLNAADVAIGVEVRFASHKNMPKQKMIRGGLLTRSFGDAQGLAPPPIDVLVALWHERQWLGCGQSFLPETAEQRNLIVFDGQPLPLSVTPGQLMRGKEDPSLKSSSALRELASQLKRARQRLLVVLHGRAAFPFASLVLLLVAIPFVFQSEGGKSTWIGVGLALVISLGFYFLNYSCQLLGQYPRGVFAGAPELAAWLPILIFGCLGSLLMYRIDT